MQYRPVAKQMNGATYRSILEAQYAAFFDLIGCAYEYEPPYEDGHSPKGWLPDFALWPIERNDAPEIHGPVLVEVKPRWTSQSQRPREKVQHKMKNAVLSTPRHLGETQHELPHLWLTNGGLEQVGQEGAPTDTTPGWDCWPWYGHKGWNETDLLQLLFNYVGVEMQPKGQRQPILEDVYDELDLLPVGYASWADVWIMARREVAKSAVTVPAPPDPTAWLANVCDEDRGIGDCHCDPHEHECPECEGFKKRQFEFCADCAPL